MSDVVPTLFRASAMKEPLTPTLRVGILIAADTSC
jgi:hypothetical protein